LNVLLHPVNTLPATSHTHRFIDQRLPNMRLIALNIAALAFKAAAQTVYNISSAHFDLVIKSDNATING
jgi:hypothetical protein